MQRTGSRGFTLIELLVVVAIIAVLIAILLPSLAQARRQAKIAACAANHRSIALATHMYSQENQSFLPPPPHDSLGNIAPDATEVRQLHSWATDSSGMLQPVYLGYLIRGEYLGAVEYVLPPDVPFTTRKVVSCPDAGPINTQLGTTNFSTISYFIFFQTSPDSNQRLSKWPTDNATGLAMTTSGWWLSTIWTAATSYWAGVDHHNATGENVAFFDGHVRFLSNQEMQRRSLQAPNLADTGSWLPYAYNAP